MSEEQIAAVESSPPQSLPNLETQTPLMMSSWVCLGFGKSRRRQVEAYGLSSRRRSMESVCEGIIALERTWGKAAPDRAERQSSTRRKKRGRSQFKIQRMHQKLGKLFDSIIEQHRAAGDGGELEDLVDVMLKIQQEMELSSLLQLRILKQWFWKKNVSFGVANVELPLTMLLYHFDWKMPKHEDLDIKEAFGATVRKKHPLHLVPIVKRPLPTTA
ncbi:hypothetical protein SASPL_106830 [Salvia splendens]|uniref:Uncharacterized protein n=1 Tax=Salvia splendens TaxID=180675 RepID=A0A8X8YFP2_SALSN|nr:hypothetical protein SASPL_106830 [Salvia splendens]